MAHKTTRFFVLFVAALVVYLAVFTLYGSPAPAGAVPLGQDVGPAIVGGEEAPPGAYPWVAALVNARDPDASSGQFCGGSLIHAQWVLTAAHCVLTNEGSVASPGSIDVVINRHRLSSNNGVRVGLQRILTHPQYDSENSSYDFALLQLVAPVNVPPVRVIDPAETQLVAPAMLATVLGWGLTQEGGEPSDVLRQVSVPIVDQTICQLSYGQLVGQITDAMLCAGYASGGKDACQGDSGGPLVVFDSQTGLWKQAGIVSWGYGCAEPLYYGVYARASAASTWISSQIPAIATPTPTSTRTPTPTAPATPTASGTPPSPTPTKTATPTPPHRLYLSHVRRQEYLPIQNPGFESGRNGSWQEWSASSYLLVLDSGQLPIPPHTGNWAGWLGGASPEVSVLQQQATVTEQEPVLQYWALIQSADTCGHDHGGVVVNNTVVAVFDLCLSTSKAAWHLRTVDLSAYAGQTVTLQIRAETDSNATSSLFVDDISFAPVVANASEVPVTDLSYVPTKAELGLSRYGEHQANAGQAIELLLPASPRP